MWIKSETKNIKKEVFKTIVLIIHIAPIVTFFWHSGRQASHSSVLIKKMDTKLRVGYICTADIGRKNARAINATDNCGENFVPSGVTNRERYHHGCHTCCQPKVHFFRKSLANAPTTFEVSSFLFVNFAAIVSWLIARQRYMVIWTVQLNEFMTFPSLKKKCD